MNIQHGPEINLPEEQEKRQFHKGFKGAIVGLFIVGFVIYRVLYPQPKIVCIYDAYQEATVGANRPLVVDQSSSAFEGNSNQLTLSGKAFIGTGQVLMDVWIAILGIIWVIKVNNVRGFGSIAVFFLTRSIIFLNVQHFPYPQNLVWRSPGLFSFTVPYDHTSDFFYSGHTGTLTTIFLEMFILNLRVPSTFAFLSLLFMMNMLLITRVHYVIDIIGGLVFATWYHRTATRFVLYIDKLLSLPFWVVKWIYLNKIKPYCSDPAQSTDSGNEGRQVSPADPKKQTNKANPSVKPSIQNELIEIQSRKSSEHLAH